MQTVALFLLAAYYKVLSAFPFVAVGALLLYVGCYQVGALLVYGVFNEYRVVREIDMPCVSAFVWSDKLANGL